MTRIIAHIIQWMALSEITCAVLIGFVAFANWLMGSDPFTLSLVELRGIFILSLVAVPLGLGLYAALELIGERILGAQQ